VTIYTPRVHHWCTKKKDRNRKGTHSATAAAKPHSGGHHRRNNSQKKRSKCTYATQKDIHKARGAEPPPRDANEVRLER